MSNNIIEQLQSNIAKVEEKLAADLRTRSVVHVMQNRLEEEIEELRSKSQHVSHSLEIKKTELHGLEVTVRSSRQELIEEERKLENLVKLMKNRAHQRVEKMSVLQSMMINDPLTMSDVVEETQVCLHFYLNKWLLLFLKSTH